MTAACLMQKKTFLQSSCPLLAVDALLSEESHSWYHQQQFWHIFDAVVVDRKVAAVRMLGQTVVGCIREGGEGRGGCKILLNINHSDKTLPPQSPVRPITGQYGGKLRSEISPWSVQQQHIS